MKGGREEIRKEIKMKERKIRRNREKKEGIMKEGGRRKKNRKPLNKYVVEVVWDNLICIFHMSNHTPLFFLSQACTSNTTNSLNIMMFSLCL